jgi:hypothetical protein
VQDLTQEFFMRGLEGRYLDRADREKSRFRSFILTSLKFFAPTKRTANARTKGVVERWCRLNSRPAKTATNGIAGDGFTRNNMVVKSRNQTHSRLIACCFQEVLVQRRLDENHTSSVQKICYM